MAPTTQGEGFQFLGPDHLAVLLLTFAVPACLAWWVRHSRSQRLERIAAWSLAAVLVGGQVVTGAVSLSTGNMAEFLANSLPLHVCGLGAYLAAWAVLTRSQCAFEIAYFWGTAGTLQAILTPELEVGFPCYDFIRFYVTHSTQLATVLFATWGLRLRPRPGSVIRVYGLSVGFMLGVGSLDWLLDWNYMYLRHLPGGAAARSPFFFVPWPWYVVALQPVTLGLFAFFYLPFVLADRLRRR